MRRWLGVFVFLGAGGLLVVLTVGAEKVDKTEKVNGHEAASNEVLIKFREATPAEIEAAKQRGGIISARKIGGTGVYRFRAADKAVATLIGLFGEDPKVEFVEPNFVLYADAVPGDPRYAELWGMDKIGAPLAWDQTTGWGTVTVGVVDTGVDYRHPDLAANVWTAPFAFNVTIGDVTRTCPAGAHGYNAIRETFDPLDDNNHGTHVSGTIGAVGDNGIGVAGVNWTSSIMGLKFLDRKGSGYTSDAIDAIEFAVQARLAGAANVRVLSNSWGGGRSTQAMREEIERAYENDMLFVVSAGNSGAGPVINYYLPTYNTLNLLAVAASDRNDYLAGFSNYGYWSIHLAAPAVDILSTVRGASYDYYNGTSMAVPHVSGTAALVIGRWAGFGVDVTTDKIRSILINTVDPIDLEPPADYPDANARNIFGNTIANGRLSAVNAVSADPAAVPPFPDYVMRFSPPMQTVVRGKTAQYALAITPYFGYSEDRLKVGLSCCDWSGVTVKMEDPAHPGTWVTVLSPADPHAPENFIPIALTANTPVQINIRIETAPNAATANSGFTFYAIDDKEGDEPGPFLYHNDTLYLNVTRR